MNFDGISDKIENNSDCNGPKHCTGRLFDIAKKDCQECLKDFDAALQEAIRETSCFRHKRNYIS